MEIVKANHSHIAEVGRLFDLYRQFYQCSPDSELATQFISDRIDKNESTIFVAVNNGKAIGFTQLYASFCSVDAIKIFILYDLFVDADSRRSGVGKALLKAASQHAKLEGAKRIDLLTAKTNYAGQSLYEDLGYKKVNEDFYAYSLDV